MSPALAVFDELGWHAMRDLELVMLWQSLICYQQKHLWLIGHIRTHHWGCGVCVYTHTHTHTHTHRHTLSLHANYTLVLAA